MTINIGDIFRIETKKGHAYLQCINSDKLSGELLIVFNKLYDSNETPKLNDIVICMDYYYIGFPLKSAIQKKIVQKVGNTHLLSHFQIPKFMRSKHVVRAEFKGWHIINTETLQRQLVKTLSDKEKELSPFGMANDTFLIEKLEEGWNPKIWN